ncbi:low molecular weight phosphatase family protein [Actinoplanes sp. NPDC049548]|uniref:arsenate reductase/protein-tyrosine-phosphatase family protein n=1 Tax=Actinoplanes sp. NPDC049548 TaxID=3155152 RepID=UPI003443E31B
MTDEPIRILFVCHANLCRSPMAERLTRHTLAERFGRAGDGVEVASAGTHAWSNLPMHPLAAEVLAEYGVEDLQFSSRRLTSSMVARADLILTATRAQRSACVAFDPVAVRRTFTIPQFGRYAAGLSTVSLMGLRTPRDRLATMIEELSVVRAGVPVPAPEDDELADPVRSPVQVFRRCAGAIQTVVDSMTGLILPMQLTP